MSEQEKPMTALEYLAHVREAAIQAGLAQKPNDAEKRESLRDFFACGALQGLLAGQYSGTSSANLSEAPVEAYKIADAMLEARKS